MTMLKDFAQPTILLETVELYARTMDFTDEPTAGRMFWIIPFKSLFSLWAVLIASEPSVWPKISDNTMKNETTKYLCRLNRNKL